MLGEELGQCLALKRLQLDCKTIPDFSAGLGWSRRNRPETSRGPFESKSPCDAGRTLVSSPRSFSSAETFGFTSSWFVDGFLHFSREYSRGRGKFLCPFTAASQLRLAHQEQVGEERSHSCRIPKASVSPERGDRAGDTGMDKGKGGGFWLEKIPMPADICE